jgi:hypothetical protein
MKIEDFNKVLEEALGKNDYVIEKDPPKFASHSDSGVDEKKLMVTVFKTHEGDGVHKEGSKVDKELVPPGVKPLWVYHPEGKDIVIMQFDKNKENKKSWGIAKNGKMILQGSYLDVVQRAIEIASNK